MRALVVACALVAACGGGRREPGAEAVARSKWLADQVCGCADLQCTDAYDRQWNDVGASLQGVRLTEVEVEALARETQRYFGCLQRVSK